MLGTRKEQLLTVITLPIVGYGAYRLYLLVKEYNNKVKAEKEAVREKENAYKEQLNNTKQFFINEYDVTVIHTATLKNTNLSVEDATFAYKLLKNIREKVWESNSITKCNETIDEFKEIYSILMCENKNAIESILTYYKNLEQARKEEAEKQFKIDSAEAEHRHKMAEIKAANDMELDKLKAELKAEEVKYSSIASAISNLNKPTNVTVNNNNKEVGKKDE